MIDDSGALCMWMTLKNYLGTLDDHRRKRDFDVDNHVMNGEWFCVVL